MVLCIVASILILTASLVLTAWVVPGARIKDARSALAAGATLWGLRIVVGKLLAVLCLPVSPWGFGLGSVAVHALLLRLTARLVRGFELKGFGATLLAALFVTALGQMLRWLVP